VKLALTEQLREPLQALIDRSLLEQEERPQRYWYPLSTVTYGIEEILGAVDSLVTFRTTMGKKTQDFEEAFAAQFGYSQAVMVNSGSSADLLATFALVNPAVGLLQPGDEILVPALTWPTQIWAAMMAGLRVRFVDSDPATLNVNPEDVEQRIGPRTRALSIVHLMGNPCDMDEIADICERHRLVLIEDCCEALGARVTDRAVGSFGAFGTFSFFFSHHITTMEGGMVACNDRSHSDVLRALRAHGWARDARYSTLVSPPGIDPRYAFVNWGFNLRPTELQAAFGLAQLERLPSFSTQRSENALYLSHRLAPYEDYLEAIAVPDGAERSWFALPFMVSATSPFSRSDLTAHMEQAGIETRPIVAGNLLRHPVAHLLPGDWASELPGAQAIHERGFYIGLHPVADEETLERVAEVVVGFIEGCVSRSATR
jgi:CDP-6-deoxy-D-xylo-4-hexulose-3-dehydrase